MPGGVLRTASRHPFLSLWALLFLGVIALGMWQWSPGCRDWRARVDIVENEIMGDYSYRPGETPDHEENPDLSPEEIRRQLSDQAARAMADERPVGCF